MPRPKALRDRLAPPMVQAPDLDKLVRAVGDALTGITYTDDRQITHITASKRRANPGEDTGARVKIAPAAPVRVEQG